MYVQAATPPPFERLFHEAYASEPFVVLRGDGPPPELRDVRGTNRCTIGWRHDAASGRAIVVTAIDNLGKGAAGQAVQCFNAMLGLDETAGLEALALVP
jgi:N-acetyl-gamma-glutamyl-phosphate reductase